MRWVVIAPTALRGFGLLIIVAQSAAPAHHAQFLQAQFRLCCLAASLAAVDFVGGEVSWTAVARCAAPQPVC